jgi:transcriptional regulator with XRE-family HTH domain
MAARDKFFTQEMGARLREIRTKRGLTLAEVGARIGWREAGARSKIAQLEAGKNRNPSLSLIVRYLRACGAKWSEFSDLLERVELPTLDMSLKPQVDASKRNREDAGESRSSETPVDGSQRHRESEDNRAAKEIVRKTHDDAWKYALRIAYPRKAAAMHPGKQAGATAAYQEYRLQANVVKRKVLEYLATLDMNPIRHFGYQKLAERMLGALRKAGRGGRRAAGSGERAMANVADFVVKQKLDKVIVERVRAIVSEVFENWQNPTADG